MHVWLSHPNPHLAEAEAAAASPLDRGLLLGDGLFETMGLAAGRAPLLPWHLERLAAGCRLLGFPPPPWDVAAAVAAVAAANGAAGPGYARLTYTRGPGDRGYAPPAEPDPRLLVQAGPWQQAAAPLRLAPAPWPLPSHPVLSRVKHTSRLLQVLGRAEASRLGAGELLWCDPAGHLAEATASNLFWVATGRLYTPHLDSGCLPGLGRRWVRSQRPAHQVLAPPAALAAAEEVFLTNALSGPVPVAAVDGVGAWPAPGPLTAALQSRWQAVFA